MKKHNSEKVEAESIEGRTGKKTRIGMKQGAGTGSRQEGCGMYTKQKINNVRNQCTLHQHTGKVLLEHLLL